MCTYVIYVITIWSYIYFYLSNQNCIFTKKNWEIELYKIWIKSSQDQTNKIKQIRDALLKIVDHITGFEASVENGKHTWTKQIRLQIDFSMVLVSQETEINTSLWRISIRTRTKSNLLQANLGTYETSIWWTLNKKHYYSNITNI